MLILLARAYDRAAIRFRGVAAIINFPETDYSRDWFMIVRSEPLLNFCYQFHSSNSAKMLLFHLFIHTNSFVTEGAALAAAPS